MSSARVRYVPLERRQGGEYAARRALFLQSYRFSFPAEGRQKRQQEEEEEGMRGRLVRRLRAAVARAGAGLVRAWRGWRPRAHPLLGCFGPARHHKLYMHDDYA